MMEINQRIRKIRTTLNITQAKFSEGAGISINALANIEYNRVEVTEVVIKAICAVYNVNEIWLRTGTGKMFAHDIDNIINIIATRDGLDEDDKEIIRLIFSIEPEYRKGLIDFLKRVIEVDLSKRTFYAARTETGEEAAAPKIPDLSKIPDEGEEI